MPTDLDIGPWRSERVIKLEIASLFCDNLGDVMVKIKKKLSPFMPMTFLNVYFNEHPIMDPEGTLLSSLVPSGQHSNCLFASIGMSCIGDEGTRNAIVHIEDPKFHASRSKNNTSSKPQNQSGVAHAKSRPPSESGHPPRAVLEDNSHQPPALMPGGIFNMVPDVLEEPSTSTSASVRRNYQRPARAAVTNDEGVVVQVQSNKTGIIRNLERPPPVSGSVSWKVASRRSGDTGPQTASLTRILGLSSQRRHVVVPSNNLTVYAKKAAAQKNWGLNAGVSADRLKQSIQNGILLDSQTWMEDGHFQTMMEMNGIPRDPEQWNETHVQIWIRWASKHFGFNKQRSEVLQKVHGRNLVCDLIAAQILKMVECPPEVSKTFLSHLKLLKERRIVAVPQDPSNCLISGPALAPCYRLIRGGTSLSSSRLVAAPVSVSNGTSGGRMRGYGRGHMAPLLTASSSAPVLSTLQQPFSSGGAASASQSASTGLSAGGPGRRQLASLTESGTCGGSGAGGAGGDGGDGGGGGGGSLVSTSSGPGQSGGQPQLWQFLLDLLTDWKYYNDIQWNTDDGEFKLLNPERVAKAWGERKNKPTMNYEKLSRALRYYYDGDMLAKVQGKKFVYKFVCNLKHLLGYEAKHLRQLVEACAMRHRDELERSRAALLYPNAPPTLHPSGRNLRQEPAEPVSLETATRFHPYNTPRLGLTALPPQTALQMRRRQRLQVQRSVNPTLFTTESTAVFPAHAEAAAADASPILAAQAQAERWRGRGGEIWSTADLHNATDDERCVEEGDITPEVEGDEIKMPSLLMGPSVAAGGPGSNCAGSAATISPLKLLGTSGTDTVMNAAAVDAELGQYLSGEFQNNGEAVSVDVTDDIELDHFLSFEDKCLPTSPNRQFHSTSTRLFTNNRSGTNSALGVTSSSVNSLTSNGIGIASSNGHGTCISLSNSSGSVCVSNENGLTPNASTSNGNRVHQVLVTAAQIGDPEGDAMLHPFLDTSSSDTINIHSDAFEPWS